MPPTQVETALQAIEGIDGAYYLRCKDGRYYASREPSINRALGDIRTALHAEQVNELLAATARKVVRAEVGTFDVVHDVAAPEDVRDKTHQPILALVALDADRIDAEAMVTTDDIFGLSRELSSRLRNARPMTNWKRIVLDWPSRWPGGAAEVTRAR